MKKTVLCINVIFYLHTSVTTAWMLLSPSHMMTMTMTMTTISLRLQNGYLPKSKTPATSRKSTIIGNRLKQRQRSLLSSSLCSMRVVVNANNDDNNKNSKVVKLKATSSSTTATATTTTDDELGVEQKVINLLFLSISFGYAIYTVLNINNGMTRGWSASEIAIRIPVDNWGAYESYLANKPIVTKTLINVIIYLLGDWLSQTAFQKKNLLNFDISRTLKNGIIGLCFGPIVHQYYEFSDAILPAENGLFTRLEKILMDQTIYLTIKCSVYISAVGLLAGEDLSTVSQTVQDKIGGIILTAWKFWPIIHCITYSIIPAQHRILWVNSVDLVWNAILASQAQKKVIEGVQQEILILSAFEEMEEEQEENEIQSTSCIMTIDNINNSTEILISSINDKVTDNAYEVIITSSGSILTTSQDYLDVLASTNDICSCQIKTNTNTATTTTTETVVVT